MSRSIANRYAKRAAARRRLIRRKAAVWKQRARRALTLMLVAGGVMGPLAGPATAQIGGMGGMGGMGAAGGFGQAAMAPTGGLVNRAVTRLQDLEANGPGWLYYGLNAADRGLGYNGSYMTLGGYIPYAEDDLGGLWAADLRTHLSEYGGFFSNMGAVRKQFIGGTILGIGVYWDYDGDQNQYELRNNPCGTGILGQFGHSYNQVGVSGEWLTDYGNIRSNGYIPVGTTAYTAGAPGTAFYQNYVMSQYGLDAALAGADLEVGAYIPGLSDWAGMISVGGYALGNERYDWTLGPKAGQDVVPFFGGVYTRLDLTLLKNWDFSLQANNDSYFDWTGFARLTYRMGGSRRRNVPDQMEQPMMRNEHIVRAHQTPEVAINPTTGGAWRVFHVNNAATAPGDGTAERPFTTLAQGDAAATRAYDIVFVNRGNGTATGYDTTFSFNAQNQYLIGDGASFLLPSACCPPIQLASNTSGLRPLLSNPAGTSVKIDGPTGGGATVANFQITGSDIGIEGTGNLSSAAGRPSLVQNVSINGDGTKAGQSGVELLTTSGTINFVDTAITDMTRVGFGVNGGDGNPLRVDYQGSITSGTATNGGIASPLIKIENLSPVAPGTTTINLAVGSAPTGSKVPNTISDDGGQGIWIQNNNNPSPGNADKVVVNIDNVSLTNNAQNAIRVLDDNSTTTITAGSGTGIVKNTAGAAITVEGGSPIFSYQGPITNSRPSGGAPSYLLNVSQLNGAGAEVLIQSDPGAPFVDTGDGIQIVNNTNFNKIQVGDAKITSSGATGVLLNDNQGAGTISLLGITVDKASSAGVLASNSLANIYFANLNITLADANAVGLQIDKVTGKFTTEFTNNISTASTTQPAILANGSPQLSLLFNTVSSAVTAGTNDAIDLLGTSGGTLKITSLFSVSGTKGTEAADITNTSTGPVVVTLPLP
jgi:hypothetical protein